LNRAVELRYCCKILGFPLTKSYVQLVRLKSDMLPLCYFNTRQRGNEYTEGVHLLFNVLSVTERIKLVFEMKAVTLFSILQSNNAATNVTNDARS
jgi:hypothetical protein